MNSKLGILALSIFMVLGGLLVGQVIPRKEAELSSETARHAPALYSGDVTSVYWRNMEGEPEGYTSADEGVGTMNYVNVDTRVTVYPNWIAVRRPPHGQLRFIPRDRVLLLRFASPNADQVNE